MKICHEDITDIFNLNKFIVNFGRLTIQYALKYIEITVI